MTPIEWTHPSVRALLEESHSDDPYRAIEDRARDLVLDAIEKGWAGPPYDPFGLADLMGLEVVARQDLEDARLVSTGEDVSRIEFNPNRRSARIRFSLAHELGHTLFSDHRKQVRYRNESHEARRADDWQLEVLCNVAAAEILMPAGAFPLAETEDLSLPHLLDLRGPFRVSTEALLRRVVKLTDRPVCLFAAARQKGDMEDFRLDYLVGSRAWTDGVAPGDIIPADSVLSQCTAVGFSAEQSERWGSRHVLVQAVGIPPYPGDRFPRVVGVLQPTEDAPSVEGIRYLRGDAAQPRRQGPTIIAHVVNDRARSWGGRGFAVSLMERFPEGRDAYSSWAASAGERRLGAVHMAEVEAGLWIASLVAQAGYGDAEGGPPRLRLSALRRGLQALASEARDRDATVHIPAIGTGQGGTRWPPIRDLVLEELVDAGIPVTVYVLPDTPMPDDAEAEKQLTLA